MNLVLEKHNTRTPDETSVDYKEIAPVMIKNLMIFAKKQKTLWDDLSPSSLSSYAFLFHWYVNRGKFMIQNKPVFLKDVYASYKKYATELRFEPVGKKIYARQLKLMFTDIKTKRHCMGVQIKSDSLITTQ